MKKLKLLLILIVILLIGGYFFYDKETQPVTVTTATSVPTPNAALVASVLTDYNAAEVAAHGQQGFPILFFNSSSCGVCSSALTDVEQNAVTIPAGVKIFKVDFDKEKALGEKYGVTTAHTWVQIDSAGVSVQKWTGGGAEELVKKLMGT